MRKILFRLSCFSSSGISRSPWFNEHAWKRSWAHTDGRTRGGTTRDAPDWRISAGNRRKVRQVKITYLNSDFNWFPALAVNRQDQFLYENLDLIIREFKNTTTAIVSSTTAVHVRYNSWYISLPSSAKQQREMTKFCVVRLVWRS